MIGRKSTLHTVSMEIESTSGCHPRRTDPTNFREFMIGLIGDSGTVYTQIITAVVLTSHLHRSGSSCVYCHSCTGVPSITIDMTPRVRIAANVI